MLEINQSNVLQKTDKNNRIFKHLQTIYSLENNNKIKYNMLNRNNS